MRANRIRLAGALFALVLIIVVVVATSGNGNDGSSAQKQADPGTPMALSPYSNIYIVDVESRKVRAITDNDIVEIAQTPAWSTQGKIAFTQASCDECISELYLYEYEQARTSLVRGTPEHIFKPTWRPDGRKVAVARLGYGIYSVDVDSGKGVRLTSNDADEAPDWSPNGARIVFDAQVSASNWDLFAIDPDGRNRRRLTRGPLQETNPAWSPRGTAIAFAQQGRNGNWTILRMKADGSRRTAVTDGTISSQEPSWSPDGSRIAYIEQVGARAYVAVVSADGGRPTRLTGDSLVASRPSWSPDGKEIVFSAKVTSTDPSKFPSIHGRPAEQRGP
jgi:Tol biopolymer transport system component